MSKQWRPPLLGMIAQSWSVSRYRHLVVYKYLILHGLSRLEKHLLWTIISMSKIMEACHQCCCPRVLVLVLGHYRDHFWAIMVLVLLIWLPVIEIGSNIIDQNSNISSFYWPQLLDGHSSLWVPQNAKQNVRPVALIAQFTEVGQWLFWRADGLFQLGQLIT